MTPPAPAARPRDRRTPGAARACALAVAALVPTAACGPDDGGPGSEGSAVAADGSHAFVAATESAPVSASTPASAADTWRLAFVDVETTGLVPGWHEMVDLGVVMTDLEGRPIDSLFVRIRPEHPERTSEGARAVNAFDADRWSELGALAPAVALDTLRAFHRRAADGASVLMVAYNSQFDTAFLDHLFRGDGSSWRELYHYFVLDIPSMAWSLGYRGLAGGGLAAALGVEDEPHVAEEHTGLTGARLNARLYRALATLGVRPLAPPGRD